MWKLVVVSLTISIARLIVVTECSFFGDDDSRYQSMGFGGDDRRYQQAPKFDQFSNDGIQRIGSGGFGRVYGGSSDDYVSAGSDTQTFAPWSLRGRRRGGEKEYGKTEEDESLRRRKGETTTTPRNEPYDEPYYGGSRSRARNQRIRQAQPVTEAEPETETESETETDARAEAETKPANTYAEPDVDADAEETEIEYEFIPPFGIFIGVEPSIYNRI